MVTGGLYLMASADGLVWGPPVFYALKAATVLPVGLYWIAKLYKARLLAPRGLRFPLLCTLWAGLLAPVAYYTGAGPPFYVAGDLLGLFTLVTAAAYGYDITSRQRYQLLCGLAVAGVAAFATWLLLRSSFVVAKLPALHPFILGMALAQVHFGRRGARLVSMALLVVAFYFNLLISQSRTGAVVLVVLVMMGWLFGNRARMWLLGLALAVAVLALLGYQYQHDGVFSLTVWEMTFQGSGELDQSTRARLVEIESQLDALSQAGPLALVTGLGPGALYEDPTGFLGDVSIHHAHFTPVFLWFKFGALGLALYVWMCIVGVKSLRVFLKIRKASIPGASREERLAVACVVFALAGAILQTLAGQEFLWNPVLGILVGSAVGVVQRFGEQSHRSLVVATGEPLG
jgi:hypothetical protein